MMCSKWVGLITLEPAGRPEHHKGTQSPAYDVRLPKNHTDMPESKNKQTKQTKNKNKQATHTHARMHAQNKPGRSEACRQVQNVKSFVGQGPQVLQ